MTNPYLSAAEEVTGHNLGQGPNTPVPDRTRQSRLLRENVKKVHVPKPSSNQTIGPIPPTKLPQTATYAPQGQLGELGSLTGFSKIRKMIFLTAVGAGFAASLMYSDKLELLLLAEHSEFKDLKIFNPNNTLSIAVFPTQPTWFNTDGGVSAGDDMRIPATNGVIQIGQDQTTAGVSIIPNSDTEYPLNNVQFKLIPGLILLEIILSCN